GTITVQANPSHVDLEVIDITTPSAPSVSGHVTLGADARQLQVVGTLVYVAAGVANALKVVDVSTPGMPVVIGTAPLPTTAAGLAVDDTHHRAYVADTTS